MTNTHNREIVLLPQKDDEKKTHYKLIYSSSSVNSVSPMPKVLKGKNNADQTCPSTTPPKLSKLLNPYACFFGRFFIIAETGTRVS